MNDMKNKISTTMEFLLKITVLTIKEAIPATRFEIYLRKSTNNIVCVLQASSMVQWSSVSYAANVILTYMFREGLPVSAHHYNAYWLNVSQNGVTPGNANTIGTQ